MNQDAGARQLRKWIAAQVGAGHAQEDILASMRASGWPDDVAADALESTLRARWDAQAAGGRPVPPAVPVPEPLPDASAQVIDAGDRQVDVLSVWASPRVIVFGNLLDDAECDALIDAARPRMTRSLTVDIRTGAEELNPDRTSRGMFFARGENAVVRRVEQRIARLLRWPLENGEGLQVLQYRQGAQYKPHYDYFDPAEPGTAEILRRGGQRVATLVMYLAAPEAGGATEFPELQLEVAPVRGNAVFFSYETPHPVTRSLHGGAPVLAGEKWIATKWFREREFE